MSVGLGWKERVVTVAWAEATIQAEVSTHRIQRNGREVEGGKEKKIGWPLRAVRCSDFMKTIILINDSQGPYFISMAGDVPK
jgi:hypothetical protein